MSKKNTSRGEIIAEMDRIERAKVKNTNNLVGREWVWPKQRSALDRLIKDLDGQLSVLQKRLDLLDGKG